jgi:hypothetical protein
MNWSITQVQPGAFLPNFINSQGSNQILSIFIHIQTLELPWFLILILFRVWKNPNKESCSLFNFLQNHNLFNFLSLERPLDSNSGELAPLFKFWRRWVGVRSCQTPNGFFALPSPTRWPQLGSPSSGACRQPGCHTIALRLSAIGAAPDRTGPQDQKSWSSADGTG